MADTFPARTGPQAGETAGPAVQSYFTRFSLSQRIEHFLLLVSFTTLGVTGLAQKYSASVLGGGIISVLGGIEATRLVHRSASVILMAVSIYHVIAVLYRVLVKRVSLSMLPVPQDFLHLYHDVLYYIGRRKHKAFYGRYNYAEKAEYLAVVWGTIVMAITGFMMWNPIATTRLLPGEAIPAAKAAHGGEAVLAVLAIILWHFYHVHIRHLNKSMFTGKISEEEMAHEHPGELALIRAGKAGQLPPPEVMRRREKIFFPVAAVLLVFGSYSLFRFVTFEETAITTLPRGETAEVFVPITPTPTATALPTATPLPGDEVALNSWVDGVALLLENRCGSCHIQTNLGNLSLATYQDALEGGVRGPAIVPGDPENSIIVQVQRGPHPGKLTAEELEGIIAWIQAGAPER